MTPATPPPPPPPPPPALVAEAPRFAEVRLATGVRLRYAEQGNPRAPVVILLHGTSDSWFSFSRVIGGLSESHRVFALDQRGHGSSDRPAAGYRMRDFADDVLAFMDAKGIARASLVGHSMGSIIAQHVAARAPGRVERLVLVGSSADPGNAVVAELRAAVGAMRDTISESFVREFQASTIQRPVPPAFFETVVAESRRVPLHVWTGMIDGMLADDAPAPLARIAAPTLAVRGDHDAVFSPAEHDALLTAIPRATRLVYEGTGHTPHWEEPERFVRDVRAFLAAAR